MLPGDCQVVVEKHVVGCVQKPLNVADVAETKKTKAEGPDLFQNRVGIDGERSPMRHGLENGISEPLPGRGHDDEVAGRVSVVHVKSFAQSSSYGDLSIS